MTIALYGFRFPLILANVSTGDRVGFIHVLWETLSSYIKKIISLPAPMLYCAFDRFVLLHKSPIFTIFIHISRPDGNSSELVRLK